MRQKTTRKKLIWSLLAAALACNTVLALLAGTNAPARTASLATAPHPDPQFHVDMKKSVEFLSSDELEGRLIGTPGIEQAADYIAGAFSKLGLQTLPGLNGYFQPFTTVTRVDPDPQKTSLLVNDKAMRLKEDFTPLRASAESQAQGQVVFAGYGISDSDRHYDDYANLDVKGKIALVMRYEPHDAAGKSRFTGDEWSSDATILQKTRVAVEHGAVGVILTNPPIHHSDEGLIPFYRHDMFVAKAPLVQVTVDVAESMLKQAGAPDLKGLQSQIDSSLKPAGRALPGVSVRMSVGTMQTKKQVENVAALLPGKGPHADEYVVVGAHYDHLGHGGPGSLAPWSHGIHHGADDNASGTTAMLKLADRFAHEGPQARSIVFIAFTAEEEGLIGSQHFVGHSPIPLDKVVAMLNLDMVGRVRDEKLLIGGEGTAADFPKLVEEADKGLPLKLGEFGKGGIGPSDHTSFALKKIPVLFFFSGLHMDYHRPSDTADKINYQGMDEVVDLGERIVKELTTMPRESYNGRYDVSGLAQLAGPLASSAPAGARASMGAIPDYAQGEDAKGGMRIGGVMPGSPADKIGLKQGDLITRFNGIKIDNMIDYTNALGKARPGDKVKVDAIRDGKQMNLDVTLAARKD